MTTQQQTLKLPSQRGREEPIYKPAVQPCSDIKNSATFIFLHGLADSAEAIQSQSASRK